MMFSEYLLADSLEQAYEANQKKSSVIVAGNLWLKMEDKQAKTAVDLSRLGLGEIEETEREFVIGAMATLRDLECHEGLNAYTKGAVREAVRHIVGVQFRNCATVGGSISGRFGFSDVLTCFLAMETNVRLFKGGEIPLAEFTERERDRDILTHLIVRKTPMEISYQSMRNEAVDFPVVAVAAAKRQGRLFVSVGARPSRAKLVEAAAGESAGELAARFTYGTNARASAEYRRHVAGVLIGRALKEIGEVK